MKHLLTIAVLLLAAAGPAGQGTKPVSPVSADFVFPGESATLPPELGEALSRLSATAIGVHITTLASPGFEGRGLGQRGLEATAEYLASTLALRGVPPLTIPLPGALATTAYFQSVPVREVTNLEGQLTVDTKHGETVTTRTFLSNVDVLFQERPPLTITGPAVFAGYGIRETTPARDDYRGLDVKDCIVVLLGGVPPGSEWNTGALRDKYASNGRSTRYEAKAELAMSLGARAVVAIEGETFPSLLASGTAGPAARYFTPYDAGADNDGTVPVVRVSPAVGDTLLSGLGTTPDTIAAVSPQPLGGIAVTIRTAGTERLVTTRNVVAMLPGSDPTLRGDAIVIGAHMDHLGRRNESVFPGADDNASGSAALLEIASAFAASPRRPRRTLVFVFWTGEEEGHLGSEYYVRHPLWPLARTAAYLNLDMIGHPWKAEEIRQLVNDVALEKGAAFLATVKAEDFIELGVPPTALGFDAVLKQAARAEGLALHLDRTDGRHGGSDYRAFARKGRPFVRFFGNYFPGYHEASDTPDQVNPAQVLKMARLAFASTWLLADR